MLSAGVTSLYKSDFDCYQSLPILISLANELFLFYFQVSAPQNSDSTLSLVGGTSIGFNPYSSSDPFDSILIPLPCPWQIDAVQNVSLRFSVSFSSISSCGPAKTFTRYIDGITQRSSDAHPNIRSIYTHRTEQLL